MAVLTGGTSARNGGASRRMDLLFVAVAAFAIVAGIAARFKGLGRWPLAIDEYYFAESVRNVLRSGSPEYACGGFYIRGIFLQYLSAGLQLAGLGPELAPRLIAAIASLIALPAVFALARRLDGRNVALLAVTLLCLSVWEVEMARFGRMYAPFQAVCLWYLYFFLRYVTEHRRGAWWAMLALSVFGVLTWEGGALLALANFLPALLRQPTGGFDRRTWMDTALAALVFIPVYWFATLDVRMSATDPALPADYIEPPEVASPSPLDASSALWRTLPGHAAWLALFGALAALCAWTIPWLWSLRRRIVAPAGLVLALAAALLQQFALCAALLVLLLLLQSVRISELLAPAARSYLAALIACALFWSAYGISTTDWHAQQLSGIRSLASLGYEFVKFPDFVREIAVPWGRAAPLLGLALFGSLAIGCVLAVLPRSTTSAGERALLVLALCMVLAASASHPPRHETRYVFFLFPLLIVIALTLLARLTRLSLPQSGAASRAALLLAALGCFALTEDFSPSHLWRIDTPEINFRIGMRAAVTGHYHPRSDVRGAAQWLESHAIRGRDVVINSFPGFDFYYPRPDYFYMASSDPRFEGWACHGGTVERWGNEPLLYSLPALQAELHSGHKVWLVLEPERLAGLRTQLERDGTPSQATIEWQSRRGDIVIAAFPAAR